VIDVRAPVMEANGKVTEPTAVSPAVPEPEAVTAPPAEAPATATPPEESEPQEPQAETGPKAVDVDRREARADKAGKATPRPNSRTEPPVADPIPASEPAPATTATVEVEAPPATVHLVARSSGSRAAPGDRIHVVRPGESLWSIAADLLGRDATVARVSREVNRLWDLNAERIRTGDPNLLFAGTRLMLR
jgi:resuscitation-promoting factor RpfA